MFSSHLDEKRSDAAIATVAVDVAATAAVKKVIIWAFQLFFKTIIVL